MAQEPRGGERFAVDPSDKVNNDAMTRIRCANVGDWAAMSIGRLSSRLDDCASYADEGEGEPFWDGFSDEAYHEPVYSFDGYSGGFEATTLDALLNGQGRAWDDDGTSYTWYPHDIGYGALDIPGEWFDEDGVSRDCDGYIVVATDAHGRGEVIDTPYGEAKVYDSGCGSTIDVYTGR